MGRVEFARRRVSVHAAGAQPVAAAVERSDQGTRRGATAFDGQPSGVHRFPDGRQHCRGKEGLVHDCFGELKKKKKRGVLFFHLRGGRLTSCFKRMIRQCLRHTAGSSSTTFSPFQLRFIPKRSRGLLSSSSRPRRCGNLLEVLRRMERLSNKREESGFFFSPHLNKPQVFYGASHFWVEDRSSNGTYVNMVRLGKGQRARLCHNDVVSLCKPEQKRKTKGTKMTWLFQLANPHKLRDAEEYPPAISSRYHIKVCRKKRVFFGGIEFGENRTLWALGRSAR